MSQAVTVAVDYTGATPNKARRASLLAESQTDRPCCPGDNCCRTFGGWLRRNWIHALLLLAAVGAIVGALLGSLKACDERMENRTVEVPYEVPYDVNVTHTTPLSAVTLIDGSGSMCYVDGAGCSESCPAGSGAWCDEGDCSSCTKWPQAKDAIPVLNDALYAAMNEGTDGDDKLRTGLVQWSWPSVESGYVQTESGLSNGVNSSNAAATAMTLNTGGTFWGPALCRCYKMLEEDPESAAANKMCILLADGDLSGDILGMDSEFSQAPYFPGEARCDTPDVDGRGADGDCPCDYLWHDAQAEGFVSENGHADTLSQFAEEFIRSKNISIFSVLVGTGNAAGQRIYDASSCADSGIPFNAGNADAMRECPYYLYLDDFEELKAKAADIAAQQKSIATEVHTETKTREEFEEEAVEEPVSICSLDFLYALLAFLPLLAFLVYRVALIKAKSKTIRSQLYEMIKNKTLSRDDMGHIASVATQLLLPGLYPGDIDYGISYLLFQLPGMVPASRKDMERVFAQNTLAL